MNDKTKKLIAALAIFISIIGMVITTAHGVISSQAAIQTAIPDNIPPDEPQTTIPAGTPLDEPQVTNRPDVEPSENPTGEPPENPQPSDNMPGDFQPDNAPSEQSRPNDQPSADFQPDNNQSQDFRRPDDRRDFQSRALSVVHVIIIAAFALIFSLAVVFLIMSAQADKFYQNPDKLTIYILANIIFTAALSLAIILLTNCFLSQSPTDINESTAKDQVTLDESNIANTNNINLSEQTSDITITKPGTYTFTGNFSHSIIVNAPDESITLILNNVEINNSQTAAIIGLAAQKITITSADGSQNILNDGGNSEYDGCIFSNAELIFNGTGKLTVNGNQNDGEGIATEAQNLTFESGTYVIASNDDGINAGGNGATITINGGNFYINAGGDGIDSNKNAVINGGTIFVMGSDIGGDAGIDTDDGFAINGGTVVALGSAMLESPLKTSQQNYLTTTLSSAVAQGTLVSLMKDNQEIISFIADKSFKTLIISTDNLVSGEYSLYTGGNHSGMLEQRIYTGGKYSPGTLLKSVTVEF